MPVTTPSELRHRWGWRALAVTGGIAALGLASAAPAAAQEAELLPEHVQQVLNNIWVFIAGVLVFFMQAGFALVEAGLTRAKNVVNIFAKNMIGRDRRHPRLLRRRLRLRVRWATASSSAAAVPRHRRDGIATIPEGAV